MMLRTCLRPLVVTAAAVFAFGAFPAQAQDGGTPAPAAPAAEKVKLEVNLAKDQAFDLVIKMTMNQNMNLGGMEITTDIEMNRTESSKIESLDDAGVATMKTKVRRIAGSFVSPMAGQMEFDSDKETEETGNPMLDGMARQFTAEAGSESTMQIGKDGTFAGGSDAAAVEAKRAMGGINKLPKEAVGVGDSWTNESAGQVQGMATKSKMKCTVKAIDADTVTVTHDGTLEMSASGDDSRGNPMAALVAKMKIKTTKISGETKISRKDGYILVSDVTTDMELELPADENAQDPMLAGGMTMVMKQKVHQERKPATPEKAAPVTPSEPEKK